MEDTVIVEDEAVEPVLTPAERVDGIRRLAESLRVLAQWCPQKPSPKQLQFLLDPTPTQLYGGAVGGGKSVAMLMGALQGVNKAAWRALVLREDLTDLELSGGMIDIAKTWARKCGWVEYGVRWVHTGKRWVFPSGAILQFGYAAGGQHSRYLGSEWDYIGWDEAVLSSQVALREVASRLNRGGSKHLPQRFRMGSNPGNIEGRSHKYLYDEFVTRQSEGRFMPSYLTDNPGIDADKYLLRLKDSLTTERYRQLVEGEWLPDWSPSAVWEKRDIHFVDCHPSHVRGWCIGVDPSASGGEDADECGIVVAALTDYGLHVTEDLSMRAKPSVWSAVVADRARALGATVYVEANLAASAERLEESTDGDQEYNLPGVRTVRVYVRGAKQLRHAPLAIACRVKDITFAPSLEGGELVRQMLTWSPLLRGKHSSPDRIDAVVALRQGTQSNTVYV